MTHHSTSHVDLPSLLELAEVVATCDLRTKLGDS